MNSPYITDEEMLTALREVYAKGADEDVVSRLKQFFADPVSPTTPSETMRISPTAILAVVFVLANIALLIVLGTGR